MKRRWVALVMVVSLSGNIALADRVELKSGEVFFGRILRCVEAEVSIQLESGGILSFRMSQVEEVRQRKSETEVPVSILDDDVDDDVVEELIPELPEPLPVEVQIETAPPPPPKRSTEPNTDETTGAAIRDDRLGFSLLPPSGLVSQPQTQNSEVRTFKDPVSNATLTISSYPGDAELLELKKRVAKTYSDQLELLEIERDAPLDRNGYEAWVIQVSGELGGVRMRHLKVLARASEGVVVLSYSATASSWRHHVESFESSVRSLRLDTTAEEA
ncbi:MAG: hypothetical protein AAF517_27375, partial [Planctomycetota bacterium]